MEPYITPLKPSDPAYSMLDRSKRAPGPGSPGYSASCYICNDDEFAQLGMSLCEPCPECGGHIPADNPECDSCGLDYQEYMTTGPGATQK